MDWFERLTGFLETDYEETRSRLEVHGSMLRSRINGASYGIGELELVSLQALRESAKSEGALTGRLEVSLVTGDVGPIHQDRENAGALFQAASQFNLLEMVSPDVTPEDGVTRYENDQTQGPACAIAAGAATIYRNYFAPIDGSHGQTATRQFDGLADLGATLSRELKQPVSNPWKMKNGYAIATQFGLDAIARYLNVLKDEEIDVLRGRLHIGLHRDVEVTEAAAPDRPLVSQAFCSALPVGYSDVPPVHWEPFASLVLEAAYEATMCATVLNARRGASNVVFLTLLGGGAFGNPRGWILAAMRRGLEKARACDLDVRIVSYAAPSKEILEFVEDFRKRPRQQQRVRDPEMQSHYSTRKVREDYLSVRRRYEPKPECIKLVIVAEFPPASGLYFYDPTGAPSEWLFAALMKQLRLSPPNKEEGLRELQDKGLVLVDATYEPVNELDKVSRERVILRDYRMLHDDLVGLTRDTSAPLVLIKKNVCQILEPRLKDRFTVLNRGRLIYFPSHSRQKKFHEQFEAVLKSAGMGNA